MAKMNSSFLSLKKSYLFIEIGKRVREYTAANPDNKDVAVQTKIAKLFIQFVQQRAQKLKPVS